MTSERDEVSTKTGFDREVIYLLRHPGKGLFVFRVGGEKKIKG